jgi:hypothetical protein
MPFDGNEGVFARNEELLGKLDKVIALLAPEDQWCKGRLRDLKGRRCIVEALRAAKAKKQLYGLIITSARGVTGIGYRTVEGFNDHDATDHTLVLTILHDVRRRILVGDIPSVVRRRGSRFCSGS